MSKIVLNGLSQEEVEMMFSQESLLETIATEAEIFTSQMNQEHFDLIGEIVGYENSEEVMLRLIGIIANPLVFAKEDGDKRFIETRSVIKGLAFSRFMANTYPNLEEAIFKSFEIVLALDEILFDIVYLNVKDDEGQYRKMAHCRIEFSLDTASALAPSFTFASIPLISPPKDWDTNVSGGYHLNESQPILRRGEPTQPKNVLEILNILQRNKYVLTSGVDQESLEEYILDKLMKKYSFHYAESIKRTLVRSSELVFNTMRDQEFYFEWKFDFRGRLYSTGYDINLQGDKFRKGIITPVIPGRVTIK